MSRTFDSGKRFTRGRNNARQIEEQHSRDTTLERRGVGDIGHRQGMKR